MRWTDAPVHFIDFEGSIASGILEYGVVTLRGGEIVAAHTRLCRPSGRIRAEDSAVHHLTAREVEGRAPFSEDFGFFAGLRETGPFAAHFAGAENSLIKSVWPYARTSPDFSRRGAETAEWGPWIDTGRLCAELLPTVISLQLETLIGKLGLTGPLGDLAVQYCPADRRFYHAALFDALAGALLLRLLLNRPEMTGATLHWLSMTSSGDSRKRSAMQQDTLF